MIILWGFRILISFLYYKIMMDNKSEAAKLSGLLLTPLVPGTVNIQQLWLITVTPMLAVPFSVSQPFQWANLSFNVQMAAVRKVCSWLSFYFFNRLFSHPHFSAFLLLSNYSNSMLIEAAHISPSKQAVPQNKPHQTFNKKHFRFLFRHLIRRQISNPSIFRMISLGGLGWFEYYVYWSVFLILSRECVCK